jgi:ankyrin repeat protein
MDYISGEDCVQGVRAALQSLPEDLDSTYEDLLQRLFAQSDRSVKRAKRLISWISCTTRSLTVKEIQTALAIKPDDTYLKEEALPDIDILVSSCAGIVTIDEEAQVLRFVHYTFQEYFARKFSSTALGDVNIEISRACLTYLLFEEFKNGWCTDDLDMDRRFERNPFLQYAAKYWGIHARGHPETEDHTQSLILKFLHLKSSVASAAQAMFISQHRYGGYSQVHRLDNAHGLWLAAHFGLHLICKQLLAEGYLVQEQNSNGITALHAASREGFTDVVTLLLDNGADIESQNSLHDSTPLHDAAKRGNAEIVELLLDRSAPINSLTRSRRTPLHEAASGGHEVVVRILLLRGADVSLKSYPAAWTALHCAVNSGKYRVISLLLDYGASGAEQSSDEETPFHIAVERGDETIVRQFLATNTNMHDRNMSGDTPIHISSRSGNLAIVSLLVGLGDVVNSKNNLGRSPLQEAAATGHIDVLKFLLSHNADLTHLDNEGLVALHDAAWNGNLSATELLLDAGLPIDCTTYMWKTPLHGAASNGHVDVVRLLLARGCDVSLKYKTGLYTVSSAITRHGNKPDKRALLEGLQSSDTKLGPYSTALEAAVSANQGDVVDLLKHHASATNSLGEEIRGPSEQDSADGDPAIADQ